MTYYIYILTNTNRVTLYTGMTNNLPRRLYEHQQKLVKGFSSRYNLDQLVYFEVCDSAESAILREKQIKAGSRQKKIALIEQLNPKWLDLSGAINE